MTEAEALQTITQYLSNGDWLKGGKAERNRSIFLSWLGIAGSLPTLEELGEQHEVTRERSRQITSTVLEASRQERDWVVELEAAIGQVRAGRGMPVTLAAVTTLIPSIGALGAHEAFWTRFARDLATSLYLVRSHFGIAFSPQPAEARDRALQIVADSIAGDGGDSPGPERLRTKVHAACLAAGIPEWREDLLAEVQRSLREIPAGSHPSEIGRCGAILGLGLSQRETVRCILEASPTALSVLEAKELATIALGSEPRESVVRAGLSLDGYAFGRSLWGLPKHLPLTPTERALIAEACETIVDEWKGSQEQWHADDLLLLLGEIDDLPDLSTLDHYTLSVILHADSDLRYLKRSVWSHPDERGTRREVHSLVEAVLREAGRPLSRKEVRRRVSQVRGLNSISMIQERGDVVGVGRGLWGLRSRDFVLDREGLIDRVRAELVECLTARGKGLHPDEITPDVLPSTIGLEIDQVRHEVLSLARRDEDLWLSHGRMIGLSVWDSMNRPSVRQALRQVTDALEGPVALPTLAVRVSEVVGREIPASRLYTYTGEVGLSYDEELASWVKAVSD